MRYDYEVKVDMGEFITPVDNDKPLLSQLIHRWSGWETEINAKRALENYKNKFGRIKHLFVTKQVKYIIRSDFANGKNERTQY